MYVVELELKRYGINRTLNEVFHNFGTNLKIAQVGNFQIHSPFFTILFRYILRRPQNLKKISQFYLNYLVSSKQIRRFEKKMAFLEYNELRKIKFDDTLCNSSVIF